MRTRQTVTPELKLGPTTFLSLLLAAGLLTSVSAHHSAVALYDSARRVEVTGTIARFNFRNPHSLLVVAAVKGSDPAIEWEIEMGPAGQLARMGWTPHVLKPGTKVRVSGVPSRIEGSHGLCCATITRIDGSPLTPGGRISEVPLRP